MNFEFWTKTFHSVADELARCGKHDPMSEELRGRFFTAASEVRRLTQTFSDLELKLKAQGGSK